MTRKTLEEARSEAKWERCPKCGGEFNTKVVDIVDNCPGCRSKRALPNEEIFNKVVSFSAELRSGGAK